MNTTDSSLPSGRRRLVLGLLGLALAGNLAVLVLPFMDLRTVLSHEPYSLLNSVRMLWHSGLYALALLVVGFSVLFPFAKLAILAEIAWAGQVTPPRRVRLEWVERFGKWSMLDVFLVCIILSLTSGQVMVGARPLIGLPIFVLAIALAMIAGEILAASAATTSVPETKTPKPLPPARRSGLWLALAGLALVGTITLPFLGINDWKLVDRNHSIASLVPTLWSESARLPAVIVGLFLVVTPVGAWIAAWRLRHAARTGGAIGPAARRLATLRRWSMLEVFGLALAIFAIEGDYLMNTDVRWGALFLAALVAVQELAVASLVRTVPGAQSGRE